MFFSSFTFFFVLWVPVVRVPYCLCRAFAAYIFVSVSPSKSFLIRSFSSIRRIRFDLISLFFCIFVALLFSFTESFVALPLLFCVVLVRLIPYKYLLDISSMSVDDRLECLNLNLNDRWSPNPLTLLWFAIRYSPSSRLGPLCTSYLYEFE